MWIIAPKYPPKTAFFEIPKNFPATVNDGEEQSSTELINTSNDAHSPVIVNTQAALLLTKAGYTVSVSSFAGISKAHP